MSSLSIRSSVAEAKSDDILVLPYFCLSLWPRGGRGRSRRGAFASAFAWASPRCLAFGALEKAQGLGFGFGLGLPSACAYDCFCDTTYAMIDDCYDFSDGFCLL